MRKPLKGYKCQESSWSECVQSSIDSLNIEKKMENKRHEMSGPVSRSSRKWKPQTQKIATEINNSTKL